MKQDIEKLKKFIRNNPPLDKEGKPELWGKSTWEEQLDKHIPNWKEILKKPETWNAIRNLKPRRDYDDLLEVILKHAPDEILAQYLVSNDNEERRSAYNVLIKDNAKRLTSSLWNSLDKDTKAWIISKIIDWIQDRRFPRFLKELEILLRDPEYFFERARRRGYFPWIYPYVIALAILESSFYEEGDILHPLWIKLNSVIENANDLTSLKIIEEYEKKFKERVQRIAEKFRALSCYSFYKSTSFASRNVMFDPSLLLDRGKAQKIFSFIKEYKKEFNFFISKSFYNLLNEYSEKNNLHLVAEFFEVKEPIYPRELYGGIREHMEYLNLFEIPYEPYKEKYRYFYENIYSEIENKDLMDILFEEWIFLQEFSCIVSKSKKVFEKFKEAGAIVLEVSKKALDKSIEKLARHKLNKRDDEILSTVEKLRGLGKWIAHGGVTGIGAVAPNSLMGALIGYLIGEGFFVLIDPEEIIDVEGT